MYTLTTCLFDCRQGLVVAPDAKEAPADADRDCLLFRPRIGVEHQQRLRLSRLRQRSLCHPQKAGEKKKKNKSERQAVYYRVHQRLDSVVVQVLHIVLYTESPVQKLNVPDGVICLVPYQCSTKNTHRKPRGQKKKT